MKNISEKIEWIFNQHRNTNHMYDNYLPYEFHLRMVNDVAKEFSHLKLSTIQEDIQLAAYGHDLIEDTRVSYNDVKEVLGVTAADIIYALTNEKGKNRKERANDKYYEGIRNTEGAVYVKLCDRISNVRYGILTNSRMVDMYRKENLNFITKLGYNNKHPLKEMFDYLTDLFKEK